MKKIFKYINIMFLLIIILVSIMLIGLVTIPKSKIKKNIEESIPQVKSVLEVKIIKMDREYSWLHRYADEMILNIIYCMDDTTPLKSIMEAKYEQEERFPSLEKAVNSESNGSTEYMRYWHGSMVIIRPLLLIFNIEQIYYVLASILIILGISLFIILLKKKNYVFMMAMTIGLVMTASHYVPFCLEYVWTYLIMFIVTMIGIKIENREKGNQNINILMFITGILTCFFDFLSTETITFLVPILCIFTIRYKEKRIKNLKQEIRQIALWMFLWLMGYTSMWIAKWILASIVLKVNALDYVIERAKIRIIDEVNNRTQIEDMETAIKRNILTLFPICMKKYKLIWWAIIISIIISVVALRKKEKKELKMGILVLIIGIIPYIRYIVLTSHSKGHYIFTFRAQIATIIAIIVSACIMIDKNRWKEEVSFRKNKEQKNGIDNTYTSIK